MAEAIVAQSDGKTVTITMPARRARELEDELLWVRADDDSPLIELWTALDGLHPNTHGDGS